MYCLAAKHLAVKNLSLSTMTAVVEDNTLQADAFKKLYPDAYFQRWVEEEVRPDGRTLGRGRPLTVGVGAVASCQGSAMVKLGSTTVLAGIQVSLGRPSDDHPDQGSLVINVEYAPFATADYRPGRPTEQACAVSERLQALMLPMRLEQQLCIKPGKAAFKAEANVYVLNADGCVLDAVLLATTTAIRDLKLPAWKETKEGGVRMDDSAAARAQPAQRLALPCQPLAISMALYKDKLLVDPTVEEESIASSSVTVVVDEHSRLHGGCHWLPCLHAHHLSQLQSQSDTCHQHACAPCDVSNQLLCGRDTHFHPTRCVAVPQSVICRWGGLSAPMSPFPTKGFLSHMTSPRCSHTLLHLAVAGVYKSGGSVLATPMVLTRCIEAAKLRYKEMSALVSQQLEEAAAEEAAEAMES